MRVFATSLILAIFAPLAQAAVVHLTEANFRDVVDGSQAALVEFYAPWCGHCKNLAPEWEIVGDTYKEGDGIVIAAVDATANQELAKEFGVKGYPTIKYFSKGSTTARDFDGGRTADKIIEWVNKETGLQRKLKKPASAVVDLNQQSFDSMVNSADVSFALVEFYAPWCGHCKNLAPKYEKVAKIFAGDKNVLIAKVDATEETELAKRFEVTGYPTLIYFDPETKEPTRYQGAREEEALVNLVNEHAGTHRNLDGSLKETAGRVAALDELVKGRGADADAALLANLKSAVENLAAKEQDAAKTYISTVEKVMKKGADYVTKEIARLSGMVASATVSPSKKTFFQLRLNVLRAFE